MNVINTCNQQTDCVYMNFSISVMSRILVLVTFSLWCLSIQGNLDIDISV